VCETPRGIVEVKTLAEALPIIDIVKKFGTCNVAHHSQDKPTIGTGDRLAGIAALVLARREDGERTYENGDQLASPSPPRKVSGLAGRSPRVQVDAPAPGRE
jgi:hypothetical protein